MKRAAILLAALLLCSCGSVEDPSSQAPADTTVPASTASETVTTTAKPTTTTATTTTTTKATTTTTTTTSTATTTTTTTTPTTTAATLPPAPVTTSAAPVTTSQTTTATTTASSTSAAPETPKEKPKPAEKREHPDVKLDTVLYDQLTGRNNSLVGCGPTSAAMLLKSEAGLDVSKDDTVELAYKKKYYYSAGYNFTSGFGVIQEDIQKLLAEYGCERQIDHLWSDTNEQAIEKIDKLLDEGHRIILGHRKPDNVLHYAVIYGRHEKNGVIRYNINDPWGGVKWEWTEQELLSRLQNTWGYDATTVQGLVKGIQWITKLPDSAE